MKRRKKNRFRIERLEERIAPKKTCIPGEYGLFCTNPKGKIVPCGKHPHEYFCNI